MTIRYSKPNYSLRNQDGGGIWLPPNCLRSLINLERIDPFNVDTVQQYPLGTIGMLDSRRFVYVEANGSIDDLGRMVVNESYVPGATSHEDEDGFEGALYAAAAAGDEYVDVADTGALAENAWEGAYFVAFPSGGPYIAIRIIGNDAGNESTHARAYLDTPLPAALTTSVGVTVYLSPFKNVTAPHGHDYESFLGVPLCPATDGQYLWVQTWGPAWVTAHGGTWPGSAAYQRHVYAHSDGTIDPSSVLDPSSGYQCVGWLIGRTVSSYGDAFVWLTIM